MCVNNGSIGLLTFALRESGSGSGISSVIDDEFATLDYARKVEDFESCKSSSLSSRALICRSKHSIFFNFPPLHQHPNIELSPEHCINTQTQTLYHRANIASTLVLCINKQTMHQHPNIASTSKQYKYFCSAS